MKKNILLLVTVLLSSVYVYSQTVPQKEAYPISVKQLHSGHSLTDPLFGPWPGQYVTLITDHMQGVFDNIMKSTTPGSPLSWRWEHPVEYGQPDARLDIADWELLIITESVPLGFANHGAELRNFVSNAWENGNNGAGTPSLLWTTWTHIDDADGNDPEYSGSFRQLLDDAEPIWEAMADTATASLPAEAPPVFLIPGHRMMARLYDDIAQGTVPTISNINEFFTDYIHPNNYGAYAIAMIHYACIYNASPVGLPNDLGDGVIPLELATYLQTMIWDVVTSYDRTGISDTTNTGGTTTQTITLTQGWNLLSFYVVPDNTSIESVFAPVSNNISIVKNSNGFFDFGMNQPFNSLETLQHESAYLVHASSTAEFTITGTPVSQQQIAIQQGWNMVGYPLGTEKNITDIVGSDITIVKNFDGAYQAGQMPGIDIFEPGVGYFIYATQPSNIDFSR